MKSIFYIGLLAFLFKGTVGYTSDCVQALDGNSGLVVKFKEMMDVAELEEERFSDVKLFVLNSDLDISVLESKNSNGLNTVMLASQFGDLDFIRKLVAQYSTLESIFNAQDNKGETPLMKAIINGHVRLATYLISEIKVNLNLQDSDGFTALMHTIKYGAMSDEFEGYMLAFSIVNSKSGEAEEVQGARADVNLQDAKGRTALMYSIQYRQNEISKLLLRRDDLEINIQEENGETALMWAYMYKPSRVVTNMILQHKDLEIFVKDDYGVDALERQAISGTFKDTRKTIKALKKSKKTTLLQKFFDLFK